MPTTLPTSELLLKASTSVLLSQFINFPVHRDHSAHSRHLRLWETLHPSLGDRYRVSSGDIEASSRALDSIHRAQGSVCSSADCRDVSGNVRIGFPQGRGIRNHVDAQRSGYGLPRDLPDWPSGNEALRILDQETPAAVQKVSAATVPLEAPSAPKAITATNAVVTRQASATTAAQASTSNISILCQEPDCPCR